MNIQRCTECYTELMTGQECGEVQLKEKDGNYGSPIHGIRAIILSCLPGKCAVQGCEHKSRFRLKGCLDSFCGYCLKVTDAKVNFKKHKSQEVYACPVCVSGRGRTLSPRIRWIEKREVQKLLSEKHICFCCFEIETFDVSFCKHDICCLCLKRMLNNDEEYICKIQSCQRNYELSEMQEMYDKAISQTGRTIFAKPWNKCSTCSKWALIQLRDCFHNFCWECISKPSPVESEGQIFMKCSVQSCWNSFPLHCLKSYIQHLMSSMQLTTLYMEPEIIAMCCRCQRRKHEVLLKLKHCFHTICLSCFDKYLTEVKNRRQATFLDFQMEMNMCFDLTCEEEVPTTCLKAFRMAIEREHIAVMIYLQVPRRREICSLCKSKDVFIELSPCEHNLCKSCTEKMYNNSKDGLATCETCSYIQHVPALCLNAVINDESLLKKRPNLFELFDKKEDIIKDPKDSLEVCKSKTEIQHEKGHADREREKYLLCPSYERKLPCSICSAMSVIRFSACPHGWCLRCLKFLSRNHKDDKLQCKHCSSCGSLGNARRFIKNCESSGLLVPSYFKPVTGSTCCSRCRKGDAMIEEIDCGHRFCLSCLYFFMNPKHVTLRCPDANCQSVGYRAGGKEENLKEKCTICLKKGALYVTKECFHATCLDCAHRILPCPIEDCKSFIDNTSAEFLSKHLSNKKDTLFICKHMETKDACCECSAHPRGSQNMSEEVVKIRRCSHIICRKCFANLQTKCMKTGISTCPAKDCHEIFFVPMSPLSKDKKDEIDIKSGDPKKQHTSTIIYEREDKSQRSKGVGKKNTIYSFQTLTVHNCGVKENGLPNLGLTCYRNSAFQILAETPNFFSLLKEMNAQSKENWTFTLCEILWRVLKSSSSKTDIEDWLLKFQVEFASIDNSFKEYTQHDSLSFLTSILSGITDEAQRKKKEGVRGVNDPTGIFRGTMHDQYTCCNCKKTEHHGESTFFSLPLPTMNIDDPKIGECLYRFLAPEDIDDVFPCSLCKYRTVQKEIQIKEYPDVLVLQLGMIYETRDYFERLHRTPKFWENFEGLSNNIHLNKINKKEFSKYKLYGIIVHTGGLTGGHYYAYVKKMDGGNWERRDDSYVRQVKLKEVLHSKAYILFYHKIENATRV